MICVTKTSLNLNTKPTYYHLQIYLPLSQSLLTFNVFIATLLKLGSNTSQNIFENLLMKIIDDKMESKNDVTDRIDGGRPVLLMV